MQSDDIITARKVLDYWFTIEFLGQDSYEMCTCAADSKRKVRAYKKSLTEQKGKERKQITAFLDLEKNQSIYDTIKDECHSCRMETWGNITIYIGKIKRELCIENIARYLNAETADRPEKNYEDIAIASFQVDSSGKYIKHTFSLSTIVWAISRLKNLKGRELSQLLSVKDYQEDISGIENTFWRFFDNFEGEPDEELDEEVQTANAIEGVPGFSEDAVSMEMLAKIYTKIEQEYISKFTVTEPEVEETAEEVYGVSVPLFQNQEAKAKYDEDNYLGLAHDYFSNDLKMVKEYMTSGKFDDAEGMCGDLINYINAPCNEHDDRNRFDLIKPKNKDDLELWMLEALNMKNAPIGKWPSRFMPAFMQQAAINFGISKGQSEIFDKSGTIFSVNGPPGTGKTTLLKELVASGIIEKAKKLVQYADPDKAFLKHQFLQGEKPNGGYSKYIPQWYSLKDDSINDYSIFVTSCNNAAVENITKELPLESGILKSLKPTDKDSDAMTAQLEAVETLFSVDQSSKEERLYNGKRDREGNYKEIYFTGYAQKLFEKLDVWGLAAAPLGKKSNLKSFYYQVLEPLHWDFYPNGQFKEVRKEKYAAARKNFKEQLKKVENLQIKLAQLGDIAYRAKQAEKAREVDGEHFRIQLVSKKQELKELISPKKERQDAMTRLEKELEGVLQVEAGLHTDYDRCKMACAERKRCIIEAQEKALSTMSSIGFFTRLLCKKKYEDAENLAESYRRQAADFQEEADSAEKQKLILTAELENLKNKRESLELALVHEESEWKELVKRERGFLELVEKYEGMLMQLRDKAGNLREQCNQAMKQFQSGDETHTGTVLDSQFISDVLSDDEERSTHAQTGNLWATDYYNREREKLLYDALQLTREFILNSKYCRDNFITLGQYWGLGTNEDKKRVVFSPKDKENMTGALYQTLFLLVPVISSTFASVGSLLRDIKTSGVIGTLIVDEAGQAQPQMAVGALFRSRRAIVVGDPKQVEPVVADDLDLLKKSYREEPLRYYQDKTLSVQRCADILNPIGTYLQNGTDDPEWVGCPLLVHRRCISPMYEISNHISYGGIMKQQTLPPGEEKQKTFVYAKSQWIPILGRENGKKDHFVKSQGDKVCEILEIAFSKKEFPELYIISPFKSVIHGIRRHIADYCIRNKESNLNQSEEKETWMLMNTGTVHTFQGKEANEVIFLLGCDKDALGAVRWVNSNIVNVAVTRAKFRLYVIGDVEVWKENLFLRETQAIIMQ